MSETCDLNFIIDTTVDSPDDDGNEDFLFRKYAGYVINIARKYKRYDDQEDDLIGEGNLALLEAIRAWPNIKDDVSCPLSTFLFTSVRRAIIKYTRTDGAFITKPQWEGIKEQKAKKKADEFMATLGRIPTYQDFSLKYGKALARTFFKISSPYDVPGERRSIDAPHFKWEAGEDESLLPSNIQHILSELNGGATFGQIANNLRVPRTQLTSEAMTYVRTEGICEATFASAEASFKIH